MNFLDLPDRINRLLYRTDISRLTQNDLILAKRWTLRLIRDSHPDWTDEQVQADYDRLEKIRPLAVDQWAKRHQA